MKSRLCGCLLAIALQVFSIGSYGQEKSSTEVAENASQKISRYKEEAVHLEAKKIFDEVERLRSIVSIKLKNSKSPYLDLEDDESLMAVGYALALEERRKVGEPDASYYWGRYNARLCSGLEENNVLDDLSARCWAETMDSFKVASDGGVIRGAYNIALMYENGWGVQKSKYVAADWYLKAAEKYNVEGNRDGALEAVEAAIRMVADHQAANRLREQLQR